MFRKTCVCCGVEKSIEEFNYRVKAKGLRQRYCRACTKLQLKTHYENNGGYYLDKARKRNDEVKRCNQGRLLAYLAQHPCVDCGEPDVVCLEFGHIRGQKVKPISAMSGVYTWETIEEEIAKCEVRCANCHRRKTAHARGYYKLFGRQKRP